MRPFPIGITGERVGSKIENSARGRRVAEACCCRNFAGKAARQCSRGINARVRAERGCGADAPAESPIKGNARVQGQRVAKSCGGGNATGQASVEGDSGKDARRGTERGGGGYAPGQPPVQRHAGIYRREPGRLEYQAVAIREVVEQRLRVGRHREPNLINSAEGGIACGEADLPVRERLKVDRQVVAVASRRVVSPDVKCDRIVVVVQL